MARKSPTIIELVIVGGILLIIGNIVFNRRAPGGASQSTASEDQAEDPTKAALARLEAKLAPPATTAWRDGLAAVVLVDVSGSMHDRIAGERRRKLEAAQQGQRPRRRVRPLRRRPQGQAGPGRRLRVQRPQRRAGRARGPADRRAKPCSRELRHRPDEGARRDADW